ncbi:MAG: ATP-binding cassette domain-containing protein [Rhodospirillales bacterium]
MPERCRSRDLCVDFTGPGGVSRAVDRLSFRVLPGAAVALVGESGSGKSVTAQAIMGILPRVARITGGEVLFTDFSMPGKPSILPVSIPAMRPSGPSAGAASR